mmetsp:Transcript_30302/g.48796  ORF Transcript_30302/g.48796 Transcript_30302/m.48796 type:complete len:395 (-) Transcript_30302:265-1449(-)
MYRHQSVLEVLNKEKYDVAVDCAADGVAVTAASPSPNKGILKLLRMLQRNTNTIINTNISRVGLAAKLHEANDRKQVGGANAILTALDPGNTIALEDLTFGGVIAEGGFAVVHRGLYLGQKVAIKRLKIDPDTSSAADIIEDLKHEVSVMSCLKHPNLLALMGSTDDPANPCIVLEHLDGTLYDVISGNFDTNFGAGASGEGRRLDELGVLPVLRDVAAALAYLHSRPRPFIHRDVKPVNVLCLGAARVKLTDFGTACELPAGDARLTECIGSALYMSPQVERELPYGLPADVFSFGCTLYEVFHMVKTGENFAHDTAILEGMETLRRPVCTSPQEMPARPQGACGDQMWKLICECLLVEEALRPTFREVVARLCSIEDHLGHGHITTWLAHGE